jgi:hypothetical protein
MFDYELSQQEQEEYKMDMLELRGNDYQERVDMLDMELEAEEEKAEWERRGGVFSGDEWDGDDISYGDCDLW